MYTICKLPEVKSMIYEFNCIYTNIAPPTDYDELKRQIIAMLKKRINTGEKIGIIIDIPELNKIEIPDGEVLHSLDAKIKFTVPTKVNYYNFDYGDVIFDIRVFEPNKRSINTTKRQIIAKHEFYNIYCWITSNNIMDLGVDFLLIQHGVPIVAMRSLYGNRPKIGQPEYLISANIYCYSEHDKMVRTMIFSKNGEMEIVGDNSIGDKSIIKRSDVSYSEKGYFFEYLYRDLVDDYKNYDELLLIETLEECKVLGTEKIKIIVNDVEKLGKDKSDRFDLIILTEGVSNYTDAKQLKNIYSGCKKNGSIVIKVNTIHQLTTVFAKFVRRLINRFKEVILYKPAVAKEWENVTFIVMKNKYKIEEEEDKIGERLFVKLFNHYTSRIESISKNAVKILEKYEAVYNANKDEFDNGIMANACHNMRQDRMKKFRDTYLTIFLKRENARGIVKKVL